MPTMHCRRRWCCLLVLLPAKVAGLLALLHLQLLVLGVLQPVVQLPAGPRNFTWLQQLLWRRGLRVTSKELAYQLQGKEVFEVGTLPLAQHRHSSAAGGAGADDMDVEGRGSRAELLR
jgi:hypothetical protein